eukprot:767046-Hanusia_phi.AAC.2
MGFFWTPCEADVGVYVICAQLVDTMSGEGCAHGACCCLKGLTRLPVRLCGRTRRQDAVYVRQGPRSPRALRGGLTRASRDHGRGATDRVHCRAQGPRLSAVLHGTVGQLLAHPVSADGECSEPAETDANARQGERAVEGAKPDALRAAASRAGDHQQHRDDNSWADERQRLLQQDEAGPEQVLLPGALQRELHLDAELPAERLARRDVSDSMRDAAGMSGIVRDEEGGVLGVLHSSQGRAVQVVRVEGADVHGDSGTVFNELVTGEREREGGRLSGRVRSTKFEFVDHKRAERGGGRFTDGISSYDERCSNGQRGKKRSCI